MAKPNSVEAEIDEIIIDWETDCRNGKYHRKDKSKGMMRFLDWSSAVTDLRRQILSVVRKQLYGIDSMPAKMEEARFYIGDYYAQENYPNLRLRLTDDFFQALKNARSDGDDDSHKNR